MTPRGSRLIILDRDGVINEDSDAFIKSVAECVPVEGSIDAIARLSQAGYTVVVATNQSGIARGLLSETTLSQIHAYLSGLVEKAGGRIAGFFYCPHGPDNNCSCRKPRPGLLYQIRDEYGSEISGVPVVGDSLRDLQAALTAGCTPVLVRSGKGERTLATGLPPELADCPQFANLAAFVDDLLN
ncbi:MAG TPA: D-glycero-beta-D-manno-heptose-1,7-bisphosphate 7-phosphatase [Pseudohongiella sp.]|nr:D-glycero-beta-D-manno-heptose-1,7-bisphosphate 7-phosphatase [Pseudohongiella sp.]|tara:strand:- start:4551 stop:5105 length:555 start_codon:yes stop_codon:yes gene_type:complete